MPTPRAGLPVDSSGSLAIDPTANVIALVELHAKHNDEMRELQNTLTMAEIRHAEEIGKLRSEHSKEMTARSDTALKALADVTTATAETLRLTLANTERNLATKTASDMSVVTDRLFALEKLLAGGAGGAEALAKAQERGYKFIGLMLSAGGIIVAVILKFG